MSGLAKYECSPREIRKFAVRIIQAGLVPFIKSSPGMGKSAIIRSIAEEFNLQLIDLRLSTMAPEDLSGLPTFIDRLNEKGEVIGKVATFAPFDVFPLEDTPLPPGKQGWLIFFDEFNSATKMVQAAAYKIVLDKLVGQARLHPNVAMACAGNLTTDRAIVNPIGTAMQSRLVHLTMRTDHADFMRDVAFKQNWEDIIVAFLSYNKDVLNEFRPDHDDETFSCQRTWDFMNKLVRGQQVVEEDTALYAGTITSGTAVSFVNFAQVYASIPKFADIIKNPDSEPLPKDDAVRYATVIHLIQHVDDASFDAAALYVLRLPVEFQTLFYRGLMVRKPDLRKHKAFQRALVQLSRELHDDIAIAA